MPFAWLFRIVGSLLFFRWASYRRRGVAATPVKFDSRKIRGQIRSLTTDATTATHLAAAVIAASVSFLITVVAVTLLILGPQWLGLVFAGVALVAWAGSAIEARRFIRGAEMRHWRRRHVVIDGGDETREVR